jgi:hypothetical protein
LQNACPHRNGLRLHGGGDVAERYAIDVGPEVDAPDLFNQGQVVVVDGDRHAVAAGGVGEDFVRFFGHCGGHGDKQTGKQVVWFHG